MLWRLAKWFSVDPLQNKYPSYSPYNYSLDNPIYYMDIDGREVKPTPAFLASKYNTSYEDLKTLPSFIEILKPYQGSKLNLVLDINPSMLKKGDFARTYGARGTWKVKAPHDFKWVTSASENYSNELLSRIDVWESHGNTYQRTLDYNNFFIAATIIHESIHALVAADVEKYMKEVGIRDPNHTLLNNHRDLFVKALTEYVVKMKLGYSKQDIEDMVWEVQKLQNNLINNLKS